jgi:hypothetical protein
MYRQETGNKNYSNGSIKDLLSGREVRRVRKRDLRNAGLHEDRS